MTSMAHETQPTGENDPDAPRAEGTGRPLPYFNSKEHRGQNYDFMYLLQTGALKAHIQGQTSEISGEVGARAMRDIADQQSRDRQPPQMN